MRLFDTHCHLDFDIFQDDFEPQLKSAYEQGVSRFVVPSVGSSNWAKVHQMAAGHTDIYYALGMHPYFLHPQSIDELPTLKEWLNRRSHQCIAVGECGLDAMVKVDMALQEKVFIEQVRFATSCQLPLVLHSRKTHHRILQILKQEKFQFGGVLHGFSGSYQQAMQFISLGFYIGIGGVITYPRANKTRQAVAQLPLESLVLETDSPDMPLNGHQGKSNHPKMLGEILSCVALLKGMSEQTIAEIVWKNSNSAFCICE
ncbi:TatD family deoxyribonuclease [Vibrio aquaticus]|uniref:TatD family deoxyribonuclease n=1 Tax=Vibrio aquaticus TaxID=2496559 RepID=A0A3S0MJ46_9VIBR|nr:TatD family hydrolase [Vibrio aquaticus]RTZ16052.1 TatD family deoxyribonuclease [Vibrio aquaticus]